MAARVAVHHIPHQAEVIQVLKGTVILQEVITHLILQEVVIVVVAAVREQGRAHHQEPQEVAAGNR